MLDLKMIPKETYDAAVASDLAVKNRKPVHTGSYAVDMIRSQVDDIVGNGQGRLRTDTRFIRPSIPSSRNAPSNR